MSDFDPAELPQFPPQDENGVDLSLIETHLRMTPAERLRVVEEWAEFILDAWRAQGIQWSGSERY